MNETKIDINLPTGISDPDKSGKATTQILYTGFYLGAIHWAVNVILAAEDLVEDEEKSVYFCSTAQTRHNLRLLMQIGQSLTEWIPDYVSDLELAERESAKPAPQTLDTKNPPQTDSESEVLPIFVEGLLNNPKTPKCLYDAIKDGVDRVAAEVNYQLDDETCASSNLSEIMTSRKYLNNVFKAYQKAVKGEPDVLDLAAYPENLNLNPDHVEKLILVNDFDEETESILRYAVKCAEGK